MALGIRRGEGAEVGEDVAGEDSAVEDARGHGCLREGGADAAI